MKKLLLVFLAITMTSFAFAEETSTAARTYISYECTSDFLGIVGSDGTTRSCFPYQCTANGSVNNYAVVCKTFCHASTDCQGGKLCVEKTGKCI